MPVRDGMPFLPQSTSSILGQSFLDFEFIIVDDGSKDGTLEFLRDLEERDHRVRIVARPSCGIASALEAGRALARGRFVARMDADDISHPDRIALQVDYLQQNPSVVALGSQVRIVDKFGKQLKIGQFPVTPAACSDHLERGSPFCHPAVMMRADALEKSGGYRTQFEPAEDMDLWLRLSLLGTFANLDVVLLNYRRHGGSVTARHARSNALATTRAYAAHRFGTATTMPEEDCSSASWSDIEGKVDVRFRLWLRACYLRAIILNGGIASVAEADLLVDSIPELVRASVVGGDRNDMLGFMVVRAIYQLARVGSGKKAMQVLFRGVRHLPFLFAREIGRNVARRVNAFVRAPRGSRQTRLGPSRPVT